MKRKALRTTALIAVGLMMTAATGAASSRGSSNQQRHDRERETVIAALQPVGAAAGWGRVKVEDRNRQDHLKQRTSWRKVEISLFVFSLAVFAMT